METKEIKPKTGNQEVLAMMERIWINVSKSNELKK